MAVPEDDYSHDVFISYHNHTVAEWVRENFHPFLIKSLNNELPYAVKVFCDKVSIEAGDEWNKAIKRALRVSKIVVAILNPRYFTSEWCFAEWVSFVDRGALSETTKNKLLIPVKYSNGDFFPDCADKKQFTDVTDFTKVSGTVIPEKSAEAVALEKQVMGLAKLIVERLKIVPDFRSDFPEPDPDRVKLPKVPYPKNPKT